MGKTRDNKLIWDMQVAGGVPAGAPFVKAIAISRQHISRCRNRSDRANALGGVRMHIVGADSSGGSAGKMVTGAYCLLSGLPGLFYLKFLQ